MESKLPMIKKEGFFSKIFNGLKKWLTKKENIQSETTIMNEQIDIDSLTIVDKNKGISLQSHNSLMRSLELVSARNNIQIINGKIDLTNMPLTLQNRFLNSSIDVLADDICILFDDEMINNNTERSTQKRNIFSQINHTLNMPRSMEKMGTPMSEERKNELYWGMLKSMMYYVSDTMDFLDEQIACQNSAREKFLNSIANRPGPLDIQNNAEKIFNQSIANRPGPEKNFMNNNSQKSLEGK